MPTNSTPSRLVIVGGGGHALVVAEAATLAGLTVAGFLDDNPGAAIASGSPSATRLGGLADAASVLRDAAREGGAGWIIALGELALRRRLIDGLAAEGLAARAANVVHPAAYVSPSARLGRGIFIGPQAAIHPRARIDDHAIINTAAVIEHDCIVGANTHIAPGAVLGGCARVGSDSLVGLGSRVLPGISIGDRCTIGAGAVVTAIVPDARTVAGIPARTQS
jgi:UDP-perosamine 4-acetyltransferase